MLDARVGRLEEKMDRIEGILVRLEPKVSEILATSARQADLSKLQVEMAGFAIVNYQFARQSVVIDRNSQGKAAPQ